MFSPNYLSNKHGIFRLSTDSVTVNTANVAFSVPFLFKNPYSGLVLLKFDLSIASDTTTTLPIVLTTPSGETLALTTLGGTAVTVSDLSTGIYLAYYESGTLQLI